MVRFCILALLEVARVAVCECIWLGIVCIMIGVVFWIVSEVNVWFSSYRHPNNGTVCWPRNNIQRNQVFRGWNLHRRRISRIFLVSFFKSYSGSLHPKVIVNCLFWRIELVATRNKIWPLNKQRWQNFNSVNNIILISSVTLFQQSYLLTVKQISGLGLIQQGRIIYELIGNGVLLFSQRLRF